MHALIIIMCPSEAQYSQAMGQLGLLFRLNHVLRHD